MRGESALVAVIIATLASSVALAQAVIGPEVEGTQPIEVVPAAPPAVPSPAVGPELTPAQPVEVILTAPPAVPLPVVEEPAGTTPALAAPNTVPHSSVEPAVAPLGPGSPTATPPTSTRPERHYAATLTVVNGRAVAATALAVLVGSKAVARSGPLASNTSVTLRLPTVKSCRVSVVASFPVWYSAVTRGNVNVCKPGRVIVRL
jgi:hypothetical protein